jgi:oligopeptidase B
VYDYNLNTRELKKLKQSSVPGVHAWNPAHYICEVKWVDNDGVQVPLTMYRHVSVPQNGENPVLLSGYGAYGTSHEPTFKPENLSLLQRGWILAVCHARYVSRRLSYRPIRQSLILYLQWWRRFGTEMV